MNRKQMEVQSRQDFILSAARQLFARQGVENTTMEDIARASDYTRRTIYSYFNSFNEICLNIFIDDLSRRWDQQKIDIAGEKSGMVKLKTWAASLYHFVENNPHYLQLEKYWDYHGINPDQFEASHFARFKKLNDDLADGLRQIFRLGIEEGSIQPDIDVDLRISHFLYSFRSILYRAFSPTYTFTRFEPREYVENFIELFCNGLTSQGDK